MKKSDKEKLLFLAFEIRSAAYRTGQLDCEDSKDSRPQNQRGSTHELAVKYRREMEAASDKLSDFVRSL
jgi:hypothetical protein